MGSYTVQPFVSGVHLLQCLCRKGKNLNSVLFRSLARPKSLINKRQIYRRKAHRFLHVHRVLIRK